MKKYLKYIVAVVAFLAIVIVYLAINYTQAGEEKIDIASKEEVYTIIRKIRDYDPMTHYSSSPYAATSDNPLFDQVVAQGVEVLPYFENTLDGSADGTFEEYTMAIVIEAICQVNLKGDNYAWVDAYEFRPVYDSYVKELKDNYTSIVESTDLADVKNEKLVKLGILSLPYLVLDIEKGMTELTPAVDELISNSLRWKEKYAGKPEKFMKNEKQEIELIKQYVENHK